MAKKKKTNPRKLLATKADLNKAANIAKEKAANDAMRVMMSIVLTVLHDKYGWGKTRLNRFMAFADELAESVVQGYVSIDDLEEMLANECEIMKGV